MGEEAMKHIRFVYWVLLLNLLRSWEKIVHGCASEFAVNGKPLTLVETARYASGLKTIPG